ncbi:MAG: DNA mismatch repair endonuclease MutL [Polyangiales bacterium]|nr:DNA mismatch repair endonuclease MutL [Sandaracinaceae bacterium]
MTEPEPRIRLLDDALIDQIAAGEVVERPASVVKELLENSLDAEAGSITVTIVDGGTESILISDDGHGMGPVDAALAVQRHATSKLRRFEDLSHIRTLGFRGEALPSIASVSRFELTTRRAEDVSGVRVRVHGGEAEPPAPIGCARGTTVSVRDLFYAVPARRKFLKARQTETSHVIDVCRRVALAHPELRLHVFSNERRVGEWLPEKDWFARAQANFGDETLQRIEGQRGSVQVRAALGAPEKARTGTRHLYLFVNGRPVKDTALARAVSFAYGSVISGGRYPAGVLHVDLPAEEVDVNAHPQKTEVRFAAGSAVHEAVTRALAKELGTQAFGGPASRPAASFWDTRLGGAMGGGAYAGGAAGVGGVGLDLRMAGSPERPSADAARGATVAGGVQTGTVPVPYPASTAAFPQGMGTGPVGGTLPVATLAERSPLAGTATDGALFPAPGVFGRLRVLGQVRQMLIVCEGDDGLVVLDQHAADERVVYHRLKRAYAEKRVSTQRLLFPERVDVTDADVALAEEAADAIAQAGFEVSALGPRTLAVHTMPTVLRRAPPARLLRDLLDELSRTGDRAYGDAVDMAIATMACHAAIRGGDPLSVQECQALLRAMDDVGEFRGHCPHGRPVVYDVSFAELEKRLGR